MKGTKLCRILVLVLALAIGFNTFASTEIVEAKAKTTCTCPYCSLVLKKTGKLLYEGSIITKSSVKKALTLTYRGKTFSSWTIVQKDKVVKYHKKGYKVTIKKGSTKKSIYLPVNRMMKLYIKSCKQLPLMEGSKFSVSNFKKVTNVWAQYRKGKDKKVTTYTVVAPKTVKANSNGEFTITIKFGQRKDTISIPVIEKQATSKPSSTPKPTASPTVEPSTAPTASPSVSPSVTPSASPSTSPSVSSSASSSPSPSVSPSASSSPSPSVSPSASSSATPSGPSIPTLSPSQKPSTSPSATPTGTSSVSPSASSSATPSVSPSTTPSPSPVPEKKFFTVKISGGKIVSHTGGEINSEGKVEEGTYVTLNFIIPDGKYGSHWADKNGNIVSRESEFSFYVKGDIEYYAVFSDKPEEQKKEPILRISGTELQPESLTVRIFMAIEVPDGYRRTEWGYVYTNKDLNENTLVVGGDVFTVINDATTSTGSAEWTNNISFSSGAWSAGTLVKFRSYAKVTNAEGKEEIIYSPIHEQKLILTSKKGC